MPGHLQHNVGMNQFPIQGKQYKNTVEPPTSSHPKSQGLRISYMQRSLSGSFEASQLRMKPPLPPPNQYYCIVLYFRISQLKKCPLFSHSYSDYPNEWRRLEKSWIPYQRPGLEKILNSSTSSGQAALTLFLARANYLLIVVNDFVRG